MSSGSHMNGYGGQKHAEARAAQFAKRGSTVVGDIHPAAFALAAAYTPVPGGVGALTIAMLMQNTVTAARARRGTTLHSEAVAGQV